MLDYSDDGKENAEYFWTIDKGYWQKTCKCLVTYQPNQFL